MGGGAKEIHGVYLERGDHSADKHARSLEMWNIWRGFPRPRSRFLSRSRRRVGGSERSLSRRACEETPLGGGCVAASSVVPRQRRRPPFAIPARVSLPFFFYHIPARNRATIVASAKSSGLALPRARILYCAIIDVCNYVETRVPSTTAITTTLSRLFIRFAESQRTNM